MHAIVLTAHTLIVLGLIVVVLLQRSDGGALGLGGGGGGFMSGRGAANALTRTTSILTAGFFATSLTLAVMAGGGEDVDSIIEGLTGEEAPAADADPYSISGDTILNTLGADDEETPPPALGEDAAGDAAGTDLDAVLDSLGTEAPADDADAADDDTGAETEDESGE